MRAQPLADVCCLVAWLCCSNAQTDVASTCCSAHYTEPEVLYASKPAVTAQKPKAAAARGQKGGGAISKRKASSEVEALHGKIGDALSLLGTMLD